MPWRPSGKSPSDRHGKRWPWEDNGMKILLHICCAPCAIYPLKELRSQGVDVTGFFFNHNIHPYQEYLRRLDTVRDYAGKVDLDMIYRDEYRLEEFLDAVAAN